MEKIKNTRVIFFGDSITKAGVQQGGYIDCIQKSINNKGKQKNYELIGAGIDGNKAYDLYLRLEEDVLIKKPGVVVIYIGINDVWHKISGIGTDIEKYEQFYRAIIKKLRTNKIEIALCTTSVIGEKRKNANPQDADLDAYSAVVKKLSAEYGCLLVDLRNAFKKYEVKNNSKDKESGILTTDGVHLNDRGSQLVADTMMKVLAFP